MIILRDNMKYGHTLITDILNTALLTQSRDSEKQCIVQVKNNPTSFIFLKDQLVGLLFSPHIHLSHPQ